MNFTTGSYFKNEIAIPNITSDGGATYSAEITAAIDKYEPEIRIDLLGYELNKALEDDLIAGIPQSDRFKALVNGSEFVHPDTGQLLKWIGFVNDEKESMIAYYIYYNYVYFRHSKLSGVGTTDLKAENAQKASPFDKLEIAWKRFQGLYAGFEYHINDCYFSENGTSVNDLIGAFNTLPSAYNFLYAHKDDYPEWVFKVKYDKDIFGL